MLLEPQERRNLYQALLNAFPGQTDLQMTLYFCSFSKSLNEIATGENYAQVVFKLILWAEANGKVEELLIAACEPEFGRPNNSKLKPFCRKLKQQKILTEQLPVRKELSEQTIGTSQQYNQPPVNTQQKPNPTPPKQAQPQPEDDLSSEKGVDYTRLRDLLKAHDWKAADEETFEVMLQAANRQEQNWLDIEDIENFPCTDLRTIDQLWVKYSNGRFGFSVQKRIWLKCGGKVDMETEEALGDAVGWRKNNSWLDYKDITFTLNAPEGHLPLGVFN